jgi:hypothetical protein
VTATSSAQSSARIQILRKNLLQGVHRSIIQFARSASTKSVSIRKLRRNNVRFLCKKCKATTARCAQSSQELNLCKDLLQIVHRSGIRRRVEVTP